MRASALLKFFFIGLCLGSFSADAKNKLCHLVLTEEPNFYIYLQEGNLDHVVRGSYPWKDDDGFREMIGRARDYISNMKSLSQKQNTQLWEALAERISHHTSGYMKNHKAFLSDGSVAYYSDAGRFLGKEDTEKFYYYFVFPPDASMHYARRSASTLPNAPDFDWRSGNDSIRRLK